MRQHSGKKEMSFYKFEQTPSGVSWCLLIVLLVSSHASASSDLHATSDIRERVHSYAEQRAVEAGVQEVQILSVAVDSRLRLRRCSEELQMYTRQGWQVSGRYAVVVRCAGQIPWTIHVPVTVSGQLAVLTLARSLPAGTLLDSSMLKLELSPTSSVRPTHLRGADEAIGKVLRRSQPKGQVLSTNMLEKATLVKRGDTAELVAEGGNINVRMGGIVLADGAVGDTVRIRNSTSGRTVEGVVLADGSILIP